MEPIAIIGITLSIIIYAYVAYIVTEALIFFYLWDKQPVQKILKRDSQYGDAVVSFTTFRNYVFWNPFFHNKIGLYNDFLILTFINKKLKIDKSSDYIYFTDDIPWWDYLGLKLYKMKMLRIKFDKKTYDYYLTKKQADIIKSWIASDQSSSQ